LTIELDIRNLVPQKGGLHVSNNQENELALGFSFVLAIGSMVIVDSHAQKKEYPEKTIRIYVTTAAGGRGTYG